LEKRHIYAALERCNNNRTQAARALGISVRTLRNKLNEYTGQPAGGSQGPEDPEDRADREETPRALSAASPKFNRPRQQSLWADSGSGRRPNP
jgi:hypothetical protein